jgi:hypothetical protein
VGLLKTDDPEISVKFTERSYEMEKAVWDAQVSFLYKEVRQMLDQEVSF